MTTEFLRRYMDIISESPIHQPEPPVNEGWNDRLPDPDSYQDYIDQMMDRGKRELEPAGDQNRDFKPHHRHGGAYDRGQADSYYGRKFDPHYFVGGTYFSKEIRDLEPGSEEYLAYKAGYEDNEAAGNFKDYD